MCFVEASPTVEKAVSCLQSGPTRSPIAKFPQHSVIACSMQILIVLQEKNAANEATDECVQTFDA